MLKKDQIQHTLIPIGGGAPPELFQKLIVGEWLNSEQAAYFLGISQNALRMMVHRRQVKYSKLGRRVRFHISDLNALLVPERN